MKRLLPLVFLYPFSVFADPFYAEENNSVQAVNSAQDFAKNPPKQTACQAYKSSDTILFDLEFEKLSLIGLVKFSDHYKALFIDPDKKLYDIAEKQYFPLSQIQIQSIDLKSVSYIDWKETENCQMPIIKTIKL